MDNRVLLFHSFFYLNIIIKRKIYLQMPLIPFFGGGQSAVFTMRNDIAAMLPRLHLTKEIMKTFLTTLDSHKIACNSQKNRRKASTLLVNKTHKIDDRDYIADIWQLTVFNSMEFPISCPAFCQSVGLYKIKRTTLFVLSTRQIEVPLNHRNCGFFGKFRCRSTRGFIVKVSLFSSVQYITCAHPFDRCYYTLFPFSYVILATVPNSDGGTKGRSIQGKQHSLPSRSEVILAISSEIF